VKNIPHPSKAHYGGEDAYFVSGLGAGAMGIADGVGGWQESGVNPAGERAP
jgi:protein phosphatase PTC7